MPRTIAAHELPPITPIEDAELVYEMSAVTGNLVDDHLKAMREWCPSNYITSNAGRSYREQPWSADKDRFLPFPVEAALEINTLTEDNLPAYNHNILRAIERTNVSPDNSLFAWASEWTAEEDQHGRALDMWIQAHAPIDPVALQRQSFELKRQVNDGSPVHYTVTELMAYAAIQERATQVSHRNTGIIIGDDIGKRKHGGRTLLAVIAGDEARHYNFYANWTTAAMHKRPSTVMKAMARQVLTFEMPGRGIADFDRKSALIAKQGIYDTSQHSEILREVFERVGVDIDERRLDQDGRFAQQALRQHFAETKAKAALQQERAARIAARRGVQSSRS